jgi:hypothetical protein
MNAEGTPCSNLANSALCGGWTLVEVPLWGTFFLISLRFVSAENSTTLVEQHTEVVTISGHLPMSNSER